MSPVAPEFPGVEGPTRPRRGAGRPVSTHRSQRIQIFKYPDTLENKIPHSTWIDPEKYYKKTLSILKQI